MKEQNVTGMLIDVKNNKAGLVTIPDELEDYYRILGCQYIDIYQRKIGDRWYTVVCDDEGALKSDAIVSAIDVHGALAFYGNLFIVSGRHDDAELHSLTDSEIHNLIPNISSKVKNENGEIIDKVMLFNVNYR